MVAAVVVGIVLQVVGLRIPDLTVSIVAVLGWVPVEAVLLCTWGSTPGKALLGIEVRRDDGSKASFKQAAARSVHVAFAGMGFGVPIIALIQCAIAFDKVRHGKPASWDAAQNLRCTREQPSAIRTLVGCGSVVSVLAFLAVANFAPQAFPWMQSESQNASGHHVKAAEDHWPAAVQAVLAELERDRRYQEWSARLQADLRAKGVRDQDLRKAAEREGALLARRGLVRLDDQTLIGRMTILRQMLLGSRTDAQCAAFARGTFTQSQLQAVLSEKYLTEWVDINVRAMRAEAGNWPRPVLPAKGAPERIMKTLFQLVPRNEVERLAAAIENPEGASDADVCWAFKTLFREALGTSETLKAEAARLFVADEVDTAVPAGPVRRSKPVRRAADRSARSNVTIADAVRACRRVQDDEEIPVSCEVDYFDNVPSMVMRFRNDRDSKTYLGPMAEHVAGPFCAAANRSNRTAHLYMVIVGSRMARRYVCELDRWGEWFTLDEEEDSSAQQTNSETLQ